MNDEEPDEIELQELEYEVGGGTEQFLSFEDPEKDLLIGFCRARFPNDPVRKELKNAALVRELHVYGSQVGVGSEPRSGSENASGEQPRAGGGDQHQHRGYGRRLLERAEQLAVENGFEKLSVLSGIGVRQYYREKLEYYQDGPYVSKRL
jgi:elongator complex protein 3